VKNILIILTIVILDPYKDINYNTSNLYIINEGRVNTEVNTSGDNVNIDVNITLGEGYAQDKVKKRLTYYLRRRYQNPVNFNF